MILIHFDGACGPRNPGGIATWAYIIQRMDEQENRARKYTFLESAYGAIGQGAGMTNNLAEYHGLLEAIKAVERLGVSGETLRIYSDSSLVVNMVNKTWGGRLPHKDKPHLKKMLFHCWAYLEGKTWEIRWIPREHNESCDYLSKRAIKEFKGRGRQSFHSGEKALLVAS